MSNSLETEVNAERRKKQWRTLLAVALVGVALLAASKLIGWGYVTWQVRRGIARGVYPTAVEAMKAMLAENYRGITRLTISSAGPNASDGSQPHVWYVIAEVHAATYADGTPVRHNGCDAPGSFFLQTQAGWFWVSEGAFPGLLGKLMVEYGLAGPGQATPAVPAPRGSVKYCQPD